jgi:hypothetical protein
MKQGLRRLINTSKMNLHVDEIPVSCLSSMFVAGRILPVFAGEWSRLSLGDMYERTVKAVRELSKFKARR